MPAFSVASQMIMSYNPDLVAMLCHVPNALAEKYTADAWVEAVMKISGGEIIETKEVDDGK